jgi:hypothetical protein
MVTIKRRTFQTRFLHNDLSEGQSTEYTVTHDLGTKDVGVYARIDSGTGRQKFVTALHTNPSDNYRYADIDVIDENSIRLTLYRVQSQNVFIKVDVITL